jgi:hypothetical protein
MPSYPRDFPWKNNFFLSALHRYWVWNAWFRQRFSFISHLFAACFVKLFFMYSDPSSPSIHLPIVYLTLKYECLLDCLQKSVNEWDQPLCSQGWRSSLCGEGLGSTEFVGITLYRTNWCSGSGNRFSMQMIQRQNIDFVLIDYHIT